MGDRTRSDIGQPNNDSKITGGGDGEKPAVKKNDIRPLRFRKQLAKVNLDLDSPRMREAMQISGVEPEDLEIK